MSLFANYMQPLTQWIHANPYWSLCITFLISMSESLAIIGAIIPGSVTMTAIGILAGSGVIRVDLTLLAAILGAIAGDSVSYAMGYFYSETIMDTWPFRKYPHVLSYGKVFFAKHGGKSVLLGRFIGPLRAIIPIIAGITRMQQGRFLIANVLSAIGWSLLYVMPGVLIGAASTELSTETATRLFILTLVLLLAIWFISLCLTFVFQHFTRYLKRNLHSFWRIIQKHPSLSRFFYWITPKNEKNHYDTVLFLALSWLALVGFVVCLLLQFQSYWIAAVNVPIHLFLQSFLTTGLQTFFIICMQLTTPMTIACILGMVFFWLLYNSHAKVMAYMFSTVAFSALATLITAFVVQSPGPNITVMNKMYFSFPAPYLTIATAFYGFIYYYLSIHYNFLTHVLRTVLFILLGLSGFGSIYLGEYWFSDVVAAYCAGLLIGTVHILVYRKLNPKPSKKNASLLFFCSIVIALTCSTGLSTYLNFKTLAHNHTVYAKEYLIAEATWWDQSNSGLSLYLLNRIGKPINLLNVQYAGDLDVLEEKLRQQGWEAHRESFLKKLLQKVNPETDQAKLPLLEVLFNNTPAELLMTLNDKQSNLLLELRMWESHYSLQETRQPLWIGNIRANPNQKTKIRKVIDPYDYLAPALRSFTIKKQRVYPTYLKPNKFYELPFILLIKQ